MLETVNKIFGIWSPFALPCVSLSCHFNVGTSNKSLSLGLSALTRIDQPP